MVPELTGVPAGDDNVPVMCGTGAVEAGIPVPGCGGDETMHPAMQQHTASAMHTSPCGMMSNAYPFPEK